MNSRIDLTFRLSWQSEALLKALGYYLECHILDAYDTSVSVEELEDLEIETFPLYNCRERGICLVVHVHRPGPKLLLFFAEHRNTDSLFVWWEEVEKVFLNGPTIEAFSDHSYRNQIEHFGDDLVKAARFICEKIGAFHKVRMERAA